MSLFIFVLLMLPARAMHGGRDSAQTPEAVGKRPTVDSIAADSVRVVEKVAGVAVEKEADVNVSELAEFVVIAKESRGLESSSRIGRDAMNHIQPTSFADLLSLIPGGMAQTPDMSSTNSIALRETGTMTATGSKTRNEDYNISSLGTLFMVDGAPLNTDASMQGIPSSASGDPATETRTTNRGVDMRTIVTDNIESVEIVRGIPSAEYGNLTSGLVNIKRIRKASPFTARFKADQYGKLISISKGFSTGATTIINAEAGFLDSKADPRDNLHSFMRMNFGVRGNTRLEHDAYALSFTYGVDYTGSLDRTKRDPDLNFNKIDEYRGSYNRFAFNGSAAWNVNADSWFKALTLNVSVDYQPERMERRKQVAPSRAAIAPSSLGAGISEGYFLLKEYIADFVSDGKPMNLFLKLKAEGAVNKGIFSHSCKAGAEWTLSKNFGQGQIYDLSRPLSASWSTRPRRYIDIPALQVLSFYAEDRMMTFVGSNTLEVQAGLRTIQLPALDNSYLLASRIYVDPRINAQWKFPAFKAGDKFMRFNLAGGYGLTTRMPTIDYLYPLTSYNDFLMLNYYDINKPEEYSRVILRTFTADAANKRLKAARNRKWEVRAGFSWGDSELSVTYFDERMNSGFRYSAVYQPYEYRRYDSSAIDPAALTGKPDVAVLPYTDMRVLGGYNKVENGSRLYKQGVEFQLTTPRWNLLHTALTVTGAWFKSTYSNSQNLMIPVSATIGNMPVSNTYIGIYDTDDGRVNRQFNTNFMFDTQIRKWGLVFTTTLECLWFTSTRQLRDNGVPVSYISAADGEIHPFTDKDADDPVLRTLIRSYSDDMFRELRVPAAYFLNLKATKKIGKWLAISAFVNHLIDCLPDYRSNGVLIRRSSNAYFGMEINVTI